MFWKCTSCGFEKNSDPDHRECQSCTTAKPCNGIVLRSKNTGNVFTLRFNHPNPDTKKTYGKTVLQILADPDIKFVSEKQFQIWNVNGQPMICSYPGAVNPLYYNGTPIPEEGVAIGNNGSLSLKNRFFVLEVNLD